MDLGLEFWCIDANIGLVNLLAENAKIGDHGIVSSGR